MRTEGVGVVASVKGEVDFWSCERMGLANSGARIQSEPMISSALLLNDSLLVFFDVMDSETDPRPRSE